MFSSAKKATRWTKKRIKINLKATKPIDCTKYVHPADKNALDALKKIPLHDVICKKAMSFINEAADRLSCMSSMIHITEKQLPRVYRMVESISRKLGIEVPELFLEWSGDPNAYTFGVEKYSIVITSGLLDCLEDDEIYAVLAHECGHIVCNHVLYQTIGRILLSGSSKGLKSLSEKIPGLVGALVDGAVSTLDSALELAFFRWMRCSELSADRIAAICCGSATPVVEAMMRLAGGTVHLSSEIDTELFVSQAEEYHQMMSDSKANKLLAYWLNKGNTHPVYAVRAYDARQFAASEEFKSAMKA